MSFFVKVVQGDSGDPVHQDEGEQRLLRGDDGRQRCGVQGPLLLLHP